MDDSQVSDEGAKKPHVEVIQDGEPLPPKYKKGRSIFDKQIMSPKKKLHKLEKLKCWPKVKNMIASGIHVKDIVYFIQIENEEYREITDESLRVTIYNYIKRHKHLLVRQPTRHLPMIASLELVDQLDAINLLYALNMDMVIGLHHQLTIEKRGTYENFDKALRSCNAIIQTMHEIKKDHRREMKTASTDIGAMAQVERVKKIYQSKYGNRTAGILFHPESRRRLLNALQKVRKSDNAEVIDLLEKNEEKLKVIGVEENDGSGQVEPD